jgi:hypothetical protein
MILFLQYIGFTDPGVSGRNASANDTGARQGFTKPYG